MSAAASLPRLFGTDGIRGPSYTFPLDEQTVARLGLAVARKLESSGYGTTIVLGGDTRRSTPDIARWLVSGLRHGGATSLWAGVLPTPGVAYLVRELGADAGISISASHNLYPDNGIKLMDAAGHKWTPAAELELEELLMNLSGDLTLDSSPPDIAPDLRERYIGALGSVLNDALSLDGMRICIDTANGAAVPFARQTLEKLGARVYTLCDEPDGVNINAGCGSTDPAALATATVDSHCDLGIAFDGDADRAVLIDELGSVWDGDAILMLWALALKRDGKLIPPKLVATTMSNFGLQAALEKHAVDVVRCDVGDRAVLETMRSAGIVLGGEQSGHIIYSGSAIPGDAIVTALHMASEVQAAERPLSALMQQFRRYPQVLRNVRVHSKPDLDTLPTVQARADAIEGHLGERGRLILRYSGTEPLARIMIEGPDRKEVESLADDLATVIAAAIGA